MDPNEYVGDPFLKIVPRAKWGALPPKWSEPLPLPAQSLLFMCTNTDRCESREECTRAMRTLQQYYMEVKGMPDIPYSFVIGGDLRVYEGRGWGVMIRRRDCEDWVDDRIVFGFCHHEKVHDKRIDKMIQKGYDLMDYAIHKQYLVDFDEYEFQGKEAEKFERQEMEKKYYEKAKKECEGDIEKERKKAEKRGDDKKKWEEDINELHFKSAKGPTFLGDKDALEQVMKENKEAFDSLKLTEDNVITSSSSSLDSDSLFGSETETEPI